jgi:predicted secreted hydrolase
VSRVPRAFVLLSTLLAAAVLLVAACDSSERPVSTSLTVAQALSGDTTGLSTGYARALGPRTFRFPDDHGPHPDFRTEWWYYTGNLSSPSGRRFGYQLTLFRTALSPPDELAAMTRGRQATEPTPHGRQAADPTLRGRQAADPTPRGRQATEPTPRGRQAADATWRTRQVYMAHLALSDVQNEVFHAFERFSRGAAGLAGARAQPYRVWLDDWQVAGPTADSVRLQAAEQGLALDLSLRRVKPIVLQGDRGFDRKGPEPGDASYYYSMTRMHTAGTISIEGTLHAVEGLSWLDREWSTSVLGTDQVGWDWFSLHLDDGRDVMFYRLRHRDGTASPFTSGLVVAGDGAIRRLEAQDVELEPTRHWESPDSGSRYPIGWSLRIPSMEMDLALDPYLEQQELNLVVPYWEGAVRVSGSHGGSGFVELTGYEEAFREAGADR